MSITPQGDPAPRAFEPDNEQAIKFLQQRAVFGETVRYKTLDRREAFFRCKQYAHQDKDWWGRDADSTETISPNSVYPPGTVPAGGAAMLVPDKRPTAPTNIGRSIVKRYTGLLFSESRRPEVKVEQDPDTEAFLKAVRDEHRFWPAMREARNKGGAIGSVVVTVHVRRSRFCYDVHNSKNVTPLWKDRRALLLNGVLIMWRYNKEENTYDKDGKFAGTRVVPYLHRRIITFESDVVYEDIRLEDANDESWKVESRVDHKLGFFPGVWIQNEAESEDIDGDADCEGAWQTIDTNDRLIAQMNKALLRNLDPTTVTKTDPKEMAQLGPGAELAKGSDYALEVGKSGDAKYLEMEGTGVVVGMQFSGQLKQTVSDVTGCVFIDDKDLAAAQSARAIEFRHAPMIDRGDDFRAQYGLGVVDLMRITEAIARKMLGARPAIAGADRPTVGRIRFDLPKRPDGTDHRLGPGGYLSLEWGPYFAPTEDDNAKTIQNSTAANQGGLVDKVTAARRVAPIFGVTDVEATVKTAQEELEAEAAAGLAVGGGVPPGDPALDDNRAA